MSKQNDPSDPATEDNLLNALESIKSLLEQSETKLTAARDSISRANDPANPQKPRRGAGNEPVVPVLEDIIEPGAYDAPIEQMEIPEITDEDDTTTNNTTPSPDSEEPVTMSDPKQTDSDTMLEFLDHLQASLEKEVRNTLMRTVVNIEKEVKKTIAEQLDTIREQVRNKK
ncbi:hypothetical protein [Thiohalophilus thiocyanatoxydans]|uniref:Uncharacterized protein n=1 Tax=Thiohalophilus thiocyanatoxydans TaxID=381308 RepID=A0A4R8IQU9_9GAMM|nr:hypothetical protein [Thiohalophilus thiocyanatoxydans]TDY01640.1 hypothetical protein EDC23_1529 [Thiohalophilus thiocyanatoxydans]